MNSIIIYATAIIIKKEIRIIRIIFGSLIGAIYATIYYITKLEIYSSTFLKLILSVVMVYISFNSKKIKFFLKELLIFYFTFGGVTFALLYFISPNSIIFQNGVLVGIYPLKMILIGGLIGFSIIILSFKTIKNTISKKDMVCILSIKFDKKEVTTNAIIDTGNFLKEPITGNPVVIATKECLVKIIPEAILNNTNNIVNGQYIIDKKYLSKIKIIPFSALGIENGVLIGIKPDKITIYYQEKEKIFDDVIIGIYNKKISKNNKYNALIGLDIIERI